MLRNKKRLVSFGCSMTWGHELHDNQYVDGLLDLTKPSKYSYTALIAKNYAMQYQCNARCGGSNNQILRLLIEYIRTQDYTEDFVTIGWTAVSRFEYFMTGIEPDYKTFLVEAQANSDDNIARMQMAHNSLSSQYSDEQFNQRYYNQVYAAASLLKSHNIPYFMVNTLYIKNCDYQQVPNLLIKDTNFGSFVFETYPVGPGHHPLELGHEAWANKIITALDNLRE